MIKADSVQDMQLHPKRKQTSEECVCQYEKQTNTMSKSILLWTEFKLSSPLWANSMGGLNL